MEDSTAVALELRGLSLSYRVSGGSLAAIEGISLCFPEGGISAIVGPSGCGKTSLIMTAAGLLSPTSGEILVDGLPLFGVRERTSVIFQDYGLLPWYTVERNAELPLRIRKLPRAERQKRVRPILKELGLDEFRRFFPGRLSGGMKQRVALARALVLEPDLLLMDEPFSSLDALTREAAQEFLLSIRSHRSLTIILVTHSIEEAVYLADTVFVMTGRNPGRVAARFDVPENRPDRRFGSFGPSGAAASSESLPARGHGGADFRDSDRYFELCREVRAALKGAGRAAASEASAP